MCGRFTLRLPPEELQQFFDLVRVVDYSPRYNIAPTQDVVTIRQTADGREASMSHWGLIPHWSKDRKMSARMINARSETVSEKPSFRVPYRRSRCLIPADGFYEWKLAEGKHKQPYHITLADDEPFAMAGLWSKWKDPESDETVHSCTILTTVSNNLIKDLHDRMPVILPVDTWDVWLDPDVEDPGELLKPYAPGEMQYRPVSRLVNSPRNDVLECLSGDSPD